MNPTDKDYRGHCVTCTFWDQLAGEAIGTCNKSVGGSMLYKAGYGCQLWSPANPDFICATSVRDPVMGVCILCGSDEEHYPACPITKAYEKGKEAGQAMKAASERCKLCEQEVVPMCGKCDAPKGQRS